MGLLRLREGSLLRFNALGDIGVPRLGSARELYRSLCLVSPRERYPHRGGLLLIIGIDLHVGDVASICRLEVEVADDAVPVRLRRFGVGVRTSEQLRRDALAVIDHDGYRMLARREIGG